MSATRKIAAYCATYLALLLVVAILTPSLLKDGVPILIVLLPPERKSHCAHSQR